MSNRTPESKGATPQSLGCDHSCTPWARVFISLACFGSATAVVLACLPVQISISHYVIEDMFYYMQAARNIVLGRGASLDGINPTNGFHPLYMLACCAIQWMLGAHEQLAVHVALVFCALSFILTGVLVYRCLIYTSAYPLALPIAAFFLCNYRAMSIVLGGLETGLNGLCVMGITWFMLSEARLDTVRRAVALGLLLGVTYLSRMDSFLLGAVVLAWLCVKQARHQGAFNRAAWLALLAIAVSFAVVLPWVIFSMAQSGTPLPNSRAAISIWTTLPTQPTGLLAQGKRLLGSLVTPSNDLGNIVGYWPVTFITQNPLRYVGLALLIAISVAVASQVWRVRRAREVRMLGWIPIYLCVHTAFYVAFGRVDIRYLYPIFAPFLVFLAVCWLARFSSPDQFMYTRTGSFSNIYVRRFRVVGGVLLVLMFGSSVAAVGAFNRGYASGRFHWVHDGIYRDLVPWIHKHVPPGARVGSFNSGIISYFSGATTVNLDGVMNDSAIDALRQKQLARYIDDQGIAYLADMWPEITKFMDGWSGDPDWRERWKPVFRYSCKNRASPETVDLVVLQRIASPR